jgi:uncharacterized tellurite resistance protein B-like protein
MIIFGTTGVTSNKDKGQFFCPSCREEGHYTHKKVRRFFTLYFIPLVPLDVAGQYVECDKCFDTFQLAVLESPSDQQGRENEAVYLAVIKKVMLHMLLADGVIDEDEVLVYREIYQKVSGQPLSEELASKEIQAVEHTNEDLIRYLVEMRGFLNEEGKNTIVQAAYYVALSDGEFHEDEKFLIRCVAKALEVSDAHLTELLQSLQQEE